MLRAALATTALALSAAGLTVSAAEDGCVTPLDDPTSALARTDHGVTGNRLAAGCGLLVGEMIDVELDGTPTWVLPDPARRGEAWFVVLTDGSVHHVTADERGPAMVTASEKSLPPGDPPLVLAMGRSDVAVGSALGATEWFPDALPDARVTEVGGASLAALAGPTDRYDHGVLGDGLEASAIDVRDLSGPIVRIELGEDEVVEGISALVTELVSSSAGPELLVTVSDATEGARLRAYSLDGGVVAESDPIGQGYRWLHQIGAGVLAPDGQTEVIAVRTPHIGGVLEAYRIVGDRLQLAASVPGYSSHQLGSPNLDMALLADADGDGRFDVVVPTQSMTELALLTRAAGGFEELGRLALDGRLVSNVAATPTRAGALALAAGTDDGRLRIFR